MMNYIIPHVMFPNICIVHRTHCDHLNVGLTILSMMHDMNRRRGKADLEMMVTIFWGTWNARNKMLIQGKRENPQVLVAKAEAVTEAYTRVKQPSDARKENQQVMLTQTWSLPQNGYAKVNVDAATNSESNLAGLGAIFRNENGKVIAAAIKVSKFFGDVSFAEAEAWNGACRLLEMHMYEL